MRPSEHSREAGHLSDSNEKKRLRLEAANELAKQMVEAQQKRLAALGYTKEQMLKESKKVDELADVLYRTRADLLDKLVERRLRALEAIANTGSPETSLRTLSKQALGKIASEFKELVSGHDHTSPTKSATTDTPKPASVAGKVPAEGTSRNTTPQEQTDVKLLRDATRLARKRVESSASTLSDAIRDPRWLPKEVRMYEPTVYGKRMKSYEEFEDLVNREFSGMKGIKHFPRMMDDVRKHFRLKELVGDRKVLEHGEVAKLAKEIGKDFGTTRDWVLRGERFKMSELLEGAISKSEAAEIIRKLKEANNGVMSLDEAKRRLRNYYAGTEYENSKNYQRDLQNTVKYFRFMDALAEGGLITDMSRKADTDSPTGRAWSEGLQPWMVKLTSSIPSEQPREGHLWLPLTTGSKNRPSDFIEVPIKVNSHRDVERVIERLKPLENQFMTDSTKRFGPTTREDSFTYALGVLLSDGYARKASDSNLAGSQYAMALGRKYPWSLDFGDGTCYHLGMLGVRAGRVADSEYKHSWSSYPSSGAHVWVSEYSPLLTWMRRSCLGLQDGVRKTDTPVNAPWILSAPETWKRSFLNGLCDGDGCASLGAQYVSIATSCNEDFLIKLLNMLGMTAHKGDTAVVIGAKDSILRAEQLGIFRYAEERHTNLRKLADMIKSWDNSREFSPEQAHLIRELRQNGHSWGSISEKVYDTYGYSWRYDVILRRVKGSREDKSGSDSQTPVADS